MIYLRLSQPVPRCSIHCGSQKQVVDLSSDPHSSWHSHSQNEQGVDKWCVADTISPVSVRHGVHCRRPVTVPAPGQHDPARGGGETFLPALLSAAIRAAAQDTLTADKPEMVLCVLCAFKEWDTRRIRTIRHQALPWLSRCQHAVAARNRWAKRTDRCNGFLALTGSFHAEGSTLVSG